MTTSYHRPRTAQQQAGAAPATNPHAARSNALIDLGESELADEYELPGAELPPDELAMEILAEQADEFTCSSCFLVRHRSQLARESNGHKYCRDCEG
ncbi:DUF4193 family protein [Arthrobacter sp. LAPM80]|uniref:DUF4193 family protein n=1 Tax=Arthrobacter sp. LAPM80 TaxID=3141788 RepID=UPI00398B3B8F